MEFDAYIDDFQLTIVGNKQEVIEKAVDAIKDLERTVKEDASRQGVS